MIDTDMAEQILQGDDTHPDIPCHNSRLQALGLEMLAEVKRLREGIEHALHIRLRHGQEEGWKELQELIE